ncbi:CIA30 family protein [Leptolyngbya sp. NIES-2104]|uniref:CIA30 family protein n=1 Tax=Leptolyngbya sp. NIES-2104 TaxID=1552121 RepID=UPI0006EC94DB|nr:CIA30 family protein [Leptolyngbya sp. NIES-2104]GAP94059.1 similar to nucleoside-diphosphate-sugar epimerases [Leptolyngbya sp. NIES-2104]
MSEQRSQWDLGRFVQTLEYFEAIPIVSWLQNMFQPRPNPQPFYHDRVLFDFSNPQIDIQNTWGALDDVVMGGVSDSSVRLENGAAVFSGNVSTANSGGFASIRTRNFEPALNLSTFTGVELRLKGDGNRYKFLIRDGDGWDSVGYSHSFDTVANEWITVQVPFAQLIPVFRAKTVSNAKLSPERIRSFQLMLSKFEYDGGLNPRFSPGSFRLEISSIAAY